MRRSNITVMVFTLILLSVQILTAQGGSEPRRMMMPEGSFKWLSENHRTEIPFTEIGNHIVIPVLVNDKTKLDLTLDTGMPMPGALLYSDKEIDKLNLNISGEMPVGGAGGSAAMAKIAQGIKFKIGDIEFSNQLFVIMPEDSERSNRFENHGVIGAGLFTHFVVEINYDNHIITLIEPEEFKPDNNSEEIPIYFTSNYPFIDCKTTLLNGDEISLNLVMDLGAGHALALNLGSNEKIVLPQNYLQTIVGRGLNSEIFGNIGRIKNFTIGSYTLNNVVATFNNAPLMPFAKEGNLGSGIFRRFNLTIDYNGKRIFITPNKFYNDPFEYNMSGLQTSKTVDGFRLVDSIIPNSPASEMNLQPGDIITEINGTPTSEISGDEILEIFTKEGDSIKLKFMRDKNEFTASIKLRRLI